MLNQTLIKQLYAAISTQARFQVLYSRTKASLLFAKLDKMLLAQNSETFWPHITVNSLKATA